MVLAIIPDQEFRTQINIKMKRFFIEALSNHSRLDQWWTIIEEFIFIHSFPGTLKNCFWWVILYKNHMHNF